MKITPRRLIAILVISVLMCGWFAVQQFHAHGADTKSADGKLTQESLPKLIAALGLKPTEVESRHDFRFKARHGDEWELSMSAVLSNDGGWIWIMAWLDELPRDARDVPRVKLLRLLADNDKLGSGKFFAYVPGNRRFVLQRVVANRDVSTKKFRGWLIDMGKTVADTHGHWSVASWAEKSETKTASGTAGSPAGKTAPAAGTKRKTATRSKRTKTSRR